MEDPVLFTFEFELFAFKNMQQPLMSVTFGSNTAFGTGSPYHESIFTFHWYMGGGYISTKTPFIYKYTYIYIHFKVYVYLDFRYICNQNHLKSRHLNPNNQTGFPDVKQKKHSYSQIMFMSRVVHQEVNE